MTSGSFNWRAAFITLPVVVLLLALGVWQLQRLEWKNALMAEIEAKHRQAPLTMLSDAPTEDLNYRRAVVSGLIDRGAAFKLWPRTHDGKSGYHWLVPMVVATADGVAGKPSGILLMVDLGWVPDDYTPPITRGDDVETISGVLRTPAKPNDFMPPNPESGAVIHWVDLSSISEKLAVPVFPYVLEADKTGDNPPIGGQTVTSLPNNHLQYAITWFVLAACVVVIFWLATRRTT